MSSGYDLSELLRRIGSQPSAGAVMAPLDRQQVTCNIELLDDPQLIDVDPLDLGGFIDGIQASSHLTYRGGRPVALQYTAAGCVRGVDVVAVRENLEIVASVADQEWVDTVSGDIPTHFLGSVAPQELVAAQVNRLVKQRRHCELSVTDLAVDTNPNVCFMVDGSLTGWGGDRQLVGVAKTLRRQWLRDERTLWDLPERWRSGMFSIPAGFEAPLERFSCYLRLFSRSGHGWDFALVRLETFDAALINPLAARCLVERQGSGRDARWDRHLGGVRDVEDILRSRRPALFT